MFPALTSTTRSNRTGHRAGARLLVALLLLAGLAAPAHAQYPSGGEGGGMGGMGGRGMGGRGHRGMMGRPGGGRATFPTPEEVEGPPTPEAVRQMLQPSAETLDRYTQHYDAHMTATRPARDSVRTALQSLRAAVASGDREAARGRAREDGPAVQRLWKDLAKRDANFDKDLKTVFDKDQLARYKRWRDDKRKADEARRREDRG